MISTSLRVKLFIRSGLIAKLILNLINENVSLAKRDDPKKSILY